MTRKSDRISKERRRYPRVPTKILLDVRPPFSSSSEMGGVVVNLSLGGLAFESTTRLETGTDIYIAMENPLALVGRIVHAFPNGHLYRYGIRFTSLGVFSQRKLEKYIGLVLRKT